MKTIEQKKFMFGQKKIEILDKGRVRVTHSSFRSKNEEVFNLFDLDNETDRYLNRPISYLIVGGLLCIPSIPFFIDFAKNPDHVPLFMTLIFLIPAIICIQQYYYKVIDIIVYRFHNNGNAAITLWNHLPSDKDVNSFIETLSSEIKSLRLNPKLDNSQKLEIYKSNLEFLADEKVITENEAISIYKRTKKKLDGEEKVKLFSISSQNK